ncbi:hypothetical protein BJY52DRAFT_1393562 [Lactarius psammicola]|nr:hypothetical protein BJY52DRAFT_1393562 [Lactarius psammicola]
MLASLIIWVVMGPGCNAKMVGHLGVFIQGIEAQTRADEKYRACLRTKGDRRYHTVQVDGMPRGCTIVARALHAQLRGVRDDHDTPASFLENRSGLGREDKRRQCITNCVATNRTLDLTHVTLVGKKGKLHMGAWANMPVTLLGWVIISVLNLLELLRWGAPGCTRKVAAQGEVEVGARFDSPPRLHAQPKLTSRVRDRHTHCLDTQRSGFGNTLATCDPNYNDDPTAEFGYDYDDAMLGGGRSADASCELRAPPMQLRVTSNTTITTRLLGINASPELCAPPKTTTMQGYALPMQAPSHVHPPTTTMVK